MPTSSRSLARTAGLRILPLQGALGDRVTTGPWERGASCLLNVSTVPPRLALPHGILAGSGAAAAVGTGHVCTPPCGNALVHMQEYLGHEHNAQLGVQRQGLGACTAWPLLLQGQVQRLLENLSQQ